MSKVSIIIPCFNNEKYVGTTIESVLNQTFTDWELIIVDDGSIDKSANVISLYLNRDPRLKLIRQENKGMQKARNRGFKECSLDTKYINFLDSDDYISPQMLEIMVAHLDENPEVGLAFCDLTAVDSKGKILGISHRLRYVPKLFGIRLLPRDIPETPFIAVGCGSCHEPSSIIRKSIYEKTNGWREGGSDGHEGIELFTQIALLSKVHYIPQALYYYRLHPNQTSNTIDYDEQMKKILVKWFKQIDIPDEHKSQYLELGKFYRRRVRPYIWLSKPGKKSKLKALIAFIESFLPI